MFESFQKCWATCTNAIVKLIFETTLASNKLGLSRGIYASGQFWMLSMSRMFFFVVRFAACQCLKCLPILDVVSFDFGQFFRGNFSVRRWEIEDFIYLTLCLRNWIFMYKNWKMNSLSKSNTCDQKSRYFGYCVQCMKIVLCFEVTLNEDDELALLFGGSFLVKVGSSSCSSFS